MESRSEIEEGTATSNREIQRIGIVQSVVLCLGEHWQRQRCPSPDEHHAIYIMPSGRALFS